MSEMDFADKLMTGFWLVMLSLSNRLEGCFVPRYLVFLVFHWGNSTGRYRAMIDGLRP